MVAQQRLCTLADLGERTDTVQAIREQARRASWQAFVFWIRQASAQMAE